MMYPLTPEHTSATDLLRCARGGPHLYVKNHRIEASLHNHTRRSDGQRTIAELAEIAKRHLCNIAVTDHNIPPEFAGTWPDGLIPGIEITTAEGVDVVVIGTLEYIHTLFERHILKNLHPTRPRICRTRFSVYDLPSVTRHRIYAHAANVEGIMQLPEDGQRFLLGYPEGQTFLEANALMLSGQNESAAKLAEEHGKPLLCTGDTHCGTEQYVGSASSLHVDHLTRSEKPLLDRFMESLHRNPSRLEHRLHSLSLLERLQTIAQVTHKNGIRSTGYFLWKTV